ncbi:lanC-like protein 2 isoform X2 [Watersipora subatra]|uniref:lanC-like protein 2 isoform X2 n=1 Tax=Watersipora subatra TaxID=2589382 RepID=UPI00355C347F
MQATDDRAFLNPLTDYNTRSESLLAKGDSGELASTHLNPLQSTATLLYNEVEKAYSSGGHVDLRDSSVYTGSAGVALLHLKRGELAKAEALVTPYLKGLRGKYKDCTFLCGDCGPLAVAAIVYSKMGEQYSHQRSECIDMILQMEKGVCASKSLPNEMLYGRAGYLYTLLYLQREIGESCVPKQAIVDVAQSIVASGQTLGGCHTFPLEFVWHDKHYFGAAHGYAGITYMLLKVVIKYPDINLDTLLVSTVDYMMSLRFPSGNYPSSLESGERDKLLHWCHGAPGFVYMFAAAFEKFGNQKYKEAVLDCTEVIWKRGLIKKGYGICHGVAGNAYAFLCAYKLTGDVKHLHRANQFALWCTKYGEHGCRTPDRPYSLFEGMAGTSYFLYDMAHPGHAQFPAFEL